MRKNIDQLLHIETEEIQKDGKDTFHLHRYEPTPYPVLCRLFTIFPLQPSDTLVDYGCGLGRLNFYVESEFHCTSIGVEMSQYYFERAMKNLDTYTGIRNHITFCHCLAQEYHVCTNENIFYFFNPFSPAIFRQVINRILNSYYISPRELTLILYYPEDEILFYLTNHTDFKLFTEVEAVKGTLDRRERFSIWKLL